MTDDTRLDDSHEAVPQAPHLDEPPSQEYTAGPMNTAVEEPMAEPEVRTAPDAGAIHWHAQLEPGIPADESDQNSSEDIDSGARLRGPRRSPSNASWAVTPLTRSGTVEG